MSRTPWRVLCALSIPVLILGLFQTASADSARAFFGSYRLSNISKVGDNVDVTLSLTIHNPGVSDVRGGIVVVKDTQPHHSLIGSFAPIQSLPHSGQLTVTKTFTIPAAEYQRWKTGHDPMLEFLVPNGEGTSIEGIQAHRTTMPGEAIDE
jgi:hypothetical protein